MLCARQILLPTNINAKSDEKMYRPILIVSELRNKANILKRFNIIIDAESKYLYLKPNSLWGSATLPICP